LAAFEKECMDQMLNTKFSGKSLLIPSDAEIKKLCKDLESSKDQEEAIQKLKSLIVNEYLPTGSAWMRGKLVNQLQQKVEVVSAPTGGAAKKAAASSSAKSVKSDKVVIKGMSGNAELELDDKYVGREHGQFKTCVWLLVKGWPSITGERVQFVKHDEKKKSGGSSGGEVTPKAFVATLKEESNQQILSGKEPTAVVMASISFIKFMMKEHPDVLYKQDFYPKVFWPVQEAILPAILASEYFSEWMSKTNGKALPVNSDPFKEWTDLLNHTRAEYAKINSGVTKSVTGGFTDDMSKHSLVSNLQKAYSPDALSSAESKVMLTEVGRIGGDSSLSPELKAQDYLDYLGGVLTTHAPAKTASDLFIGGDASGGITDSSLHLSLGGRLVRGGYLDDPSTIGGEVDDAEEGAPIKDGSINTSTFSAYKDAETINASRTGKVTTAGEVEYILGLNE
jgi:hypothetical protein